MKTDAPRCYTGLFADATDAQWPVHAQQPQDSHARLIGNRQKNRVLGYLGDVAALGVSIDGIGIIAIHNSNCTTLVVFLQNKGYRVSQCGRLPHCKSRG